MKNTSQYRFHCHVQSTDNYGTAMYFVKRSISQIFHHKLILFAYQKITHIQNIAQHISTSSYARTHNFVIIR